MTSPDTNSLVSLSDADIMRMGVAALLRIAAALEAQQGPEPETLEYPLSQLKGFDWSAIGATIVATDEDGVSTIRTAEGKFAKRRSNDKFGVEVWFSYATGKKPDGNTYGVAGSVPLRRTYEEHYLIVQVRLTEAASGVEVWSNSAENRSNDDGQAARNKVLRQTIQDALSNYPPAP